MRFLAGPPETSSWRVGGPGDSGDSRRARLAALSFENASSVVSRRSGNQIGNLAFWRAGTIPHSLVEGGAWHPPSWQGCQELAVMPTQGCQKVATLPGGRSARVAGTLRCAVALADRRKGPQQLGPP